MSTTDTIAISLQDIHKQYRTGFWGKRFTALDGLSLEIRQGEIFGYLGPNGAGKTTTFKVLLDLIRPDKGRVAFFGQPATLASRERIGFLPENPYFYMYLNAAESLHFHGQLKGMPRQKRKERVPELLRLVGLDHAAKRPLKKFSRGMLQRIGIAQALVNDPDILILDEPMSGLDPDGRARMRDIILACREQGKTVIFSSHILSDVEVMCDRAAVIRNGRLQQVVAVNEILDNSTAHWELTCDIFPEVERFAQDVVYKGVNQVLLRADNEQDARQLMLDVEAAGGRIVAFGPRRTSLEELYRQPAQEAV